MTMEQQKLPNDEDYERNRRATNIFLLVAAIIIVGGGSEQPRIGRCSVAMTHFFRLLVCALTRLFRSRARFEAEILVLRHQLNVLRRKAPKRMAFSSIDRLAHISEVCTINTSGFDLR